jgi:type IV secretion system protein VirB9
MMRILLLTLVLFCAFVEASLAVNPVTTDNRIKTFVYNPNEVYTVVINYGYQTNIEFSKGEEVETLSIGDTYSWKITPVGRRLFIKPLEEDVNTNMTVVTNKRTYQFDVVSKSMEPNDVDMELAYVVKFYYPEVTKNKRNNTRYKVESPAGTEAEKHFDYSIE